MKLGGNWQHVGSCGSTNDELLALGRSGALEGTVFTADAQDQGRGRQGRTWFSPPGENLYLSVLLRPDVPPARAPFLTLCAGVALVEAAAAALNRAVAKGPPHPAPRQPIAQLKWPNDLLLGPRGGPLHKAGGILTEMVCSAGRVDFVVIGVGVNVNCQTFPPGLAATSLRAQLPTAVGPLSVPGFASLLLAHLQIQYELFLAQGPQPILRAFETHAAYLGQPTPITVNSGDRTLRGTPVGLDDDGALLVRGDTGELHRIVAGEIVSQVAPPRPLPFDAPS
jgi:BirA family biotin operon repressor/biotin-[acetyl-CoA-carboxylase] ligase